MIYDNSNPIFIHAAHQARFLGLPTAVYAAGSESETEETELSVAQRGG